MKLLRTIVSAISKDLAEYYTLFAMVIAVPVSVALLTDYRWGILTSFVAQAIIGIFYVRNTNDEDTK